MNVLLELINAIVIMAFVSILVVSITANARQDMHWMILERSARVHTDIFLCLPRNTHAVMLVWLNLCFLLSPRDYSKHRLCDTVVDLVHSGFNSCVQHPQ